MTAINFSPFIGEFSRFKLELVLWDGNSQLVDCKDLINQSKAEKISQIFQGGFQIDEFRSKNFHKARLITCDKTSAEFAQIQQSSFTSLFLDFMPLPEFGEWSFQLSFSCKSCFNCEEQQLINDSSTPCNGFAIKIPIEVSNYDEFGAYHTPSGDITVKTTTNENVGVGLGISLFVIVLLLPLLLFFIIPWWNFGIKKKSEITIKNGKYLK
ncbi:MAG: hypothetical protein EZS28_009466 [Streblomastix strix]|uniref:Uncharacterized protein n=1 Tax=Streblomastix strix TaxID=222440 RepID=A0A5J4WJH9_9EUKA|nr:MAG: hypothetical protein EZS28_009466 [Streblomastix strix]